MSHEQTGGWRADILMDAVAGIRTIDLALHLVGVRGGPLEIRARQDLGDAVDAFRAGDQVSANATAADLAEEIQKSRQPGRGAAA
ncbi:MAG TPA: hypothetical protein VGH54_09680 [Mycobacterium sp.]|jgi:hypothetical protein|uniref:hypothetical protein n=1 Tax=Mycobacterium sp. TaxID=1785 RepID=UPI002F3ED737